MTVSFILLITLLSTISGCLQQEKNTIYVGSKDSDYNTIQEAINTAKNGATIIIKSGTYNEVIIINKTLTLRGEDKNTTIINFSPDKQITTQVPIITINADNCSIENLQITLSNNSVIAQGISINSNYNTIKNTIITHFIDGIGLSADSGSNTIIHNEIKNNQNGIVASNSDFNNISHNILSNNQEYNIYLSTDSNTNKVSFNIMDTSMYGIRIKGSQHNNVYKNCINNNDRGIYCCCGAESNYLYDNTLRNNSVRNGEENEGLTNIWYNNQTGTGNYWDDYTGSDENHDGIGDTPYTIPDAENQDIYPLMTPPLDVVCTYNNNNTLPNNNNNNNNTLPSGADSQFIGNWEMRVLGSTIPYKFNNDGTLWTGTSNSTMYNTGTWKVKNDQLCLYNNTVCYTYVFSTNGNTLTLNASGRTFGHPSRMILIKEGTQTYFIMKLDSKTNRLTVVTEDPTTKYKWKDIDIHFMYQQAAYQVFYANGAPIDTVNQTSGAGDTEVSMGDYILISATSYTGNVTLYLRYEPTNTVFGTYMINV